MTKLITRYYPKHYIVLTFDICSSTIILENLLQIDRFEEWCKFLNWIKQYLKKQSKSLEFNLYKFTGDGWILLFDGETPGKNIVNFLDDFCMNFHSRFNEKILKILEIHPKVIGLTFGMDKNKLVKIKMNRRDEYVGRAINVACRLQGAIKDNDPAPQYKMLMSNHLFNSFKDDFSGYECREAERVLKNIAGDKVVSCTKIWLRGATEPSN